jgi:hypothetical protein
MFRFMIAQVICTGLMTTFTGIATSFPQRLQAAYRSQPSREAYKKNP